MAATAAKEKDKDETKDEKKVKEKDDGVINAVYKVNLHCKQCARDIKKPLMATQGMYRAAFLVVKSIPCVNSSPCMSFSQYICAN